ncbi:MAG TPA: DUF1697 domain-containing protein [Cellulomonadaceae bacterium]|nr:DUF1697 domain-containing protein [Cellulomonadaceae bacterium]
MTTFIVLLRGVNVSASTRVPMAELRRIATNAGGTGVTTLLNSGNVVLDADDDADAAAALAARVRLGLRESFGREIDTVVVPAARLDAVIAANPFPAQAADDPAHLVVTWYLEPPAPHRIAAFDPARHGPEQMRWHDGVSYTWYPVDIGHSTLTPTVLARALGPGTARNWSTVLKLAAAARDRR